MTETEDMKMEERVDLTEPALIWPNVKERIEYAFTLKGVDYYSFADYISTPYDRAFNALLYYQEAEMNCDRDFLIQYCAKMDSLVNSNPIKVAEIARLTGMLRDRVEFVFVPRLAYKLCSVMFFDRSENPLRHDHRYAERKAELFRKAPIPDFFLSVPVRRLVPVGTLSADDLQSYIQTADTMDKEMTSRVSTT